MRDEKKWIWNNNNAKIKLNPAKRETRKKQNCKSQNQNRFVVRFIFSQCSHTHTQPLRGVCFFLSKNHKIEIFAIANFKSAVNNLCLP